MTDEVAESSMMDRIAGAMGFPGQAEEAAAAEAPEAPAADADFAEIDWDGGKFKVPQALKDAFMRNQDYTQKTQTLAEQQRALEHSRELMTRAQMDAQFRESVSAETKELAVIEAYLKEADKINWRGMDVPTMLQTQRELQQIERRRADLDKAIESKRVQFNDTMKSKLSELRAKSRELAAKSIPGFSEETEKAVHSYARSEGLTDSEIENVLLDPRSAKVLWKAMQFDKVKAGSAKAAETATKALKPGASHEKMPEEVKSKLNYRKEMKGAKNSAEKAQIIEGRLQGLFGKGIN
jgi:hypothetical protein